MQKLNQAKRHLLALAVSSLALSACVTTTPVEGSKQFSLGDNASGDPCVAAQNWTDPSFGQSAVKFANAYSINCRGATTGALGRVRIFETVSSRMSFSDALSCGQSGDISLDGFRNASVKMCNDTGLGFNAVVADAERDGKYYQFSSASNAIGASYQATRILAGLDSPKSASSTLKPFEISDIPAASGLVSTGSASGARETLDSILGRGTTLNFRGLNSDASRYLNTVINTLDETAPQRDRAELKLEAALADSNISFFRSADKQFEEAKSIVGMLDSAERLALSSKLRNYEGLHALNKRDFSEARNLLKPLVNSDQQSQSSLADSNTFIRLNSLDPDVSDVRSSIALPDERILRDAFLYTQAAWALSVAEISLGNGNGASAALDNAEERFDLLKGLLSSARIRQDGIYWMEAQLNRQRGRIEASSGNYTRSLELFDSAIESLVRGSIAKSGTGTEPAIAELKLERAALSARANLPQKQVDDAYEEAVEALLGARGESFTFRTAVLGPYLDRLVEQILSGDKSAEEKFFLAMQVKGETGAARQISQLQAIVSTDSESGGLLRDVEELQRDITGLDLQITEARSQGTETSNFEVQRAAKQQRYFELDAQIQSDARLSSVSSRPASIADLQSAMKSGEAYVKFNLTGEQIFGILVQKDSVRPIRPSQSATDVLIFKDRLRASIDGQIESGTLPEFSVASAAVLYQILFSDVDDIIADKRSGVTDLIVDGGEVLNGISAAVLVRDREDVKRFIRQSNKFDYTDIDFLAKSVTTSVAISPRSFIASRDTAPSAASEPLIGFASPEPLNLYSAIPDSVRVGPCVLTRTELRGLSSRFAPIPVDEVKIAARALGLPSAAKTVTGGSFTDTELLSMGSSSGDLSNYKVLHFATHGLTEGQFGCPEAPAALLTSFGDAGSDMLLSFDEIARLRLDANLVVLSACETASAIGERALRLSGESRPGATLEGLVRSFFSANARSVMATYWESSNSGESEMFMESFYRSGKDENISTALNTAQKSLMAGTETSHPFYWGGFFVVGNTTNSMLSSSSVPMVSAPSSRKGL